MLCGIYEIVDTRKRCYIGSSVNIHKRWEQHRRSLHAGRHHSPRLQSAWNELGPDSFTFRILEFVEDEQDLLKSEQRWLSLYRPALNVATVAGRPEWSVEARDAFKSRNLDRSIREQIALTLENEDARTWADFIGRSLDLAFKNRHDGIDVKLLFTWKRLCYRSKRGADPWEDDGYTYDYPFLRLRRNLGTNATRLTRAALAWHHLYCSDELCKHSEYSSALAGSAA